MATIILQMKRESPTKINEPNQIKTKPNQTKHKQKSATIKTVWFECGCDHWSPIHFWVIKVVIIKSIDVKHSII